MKNVHRLLEIDAIRGLAALSIVLFHYASSYKWTDYHLYHYFDYLEECVQIFFIISGFVILISIKNISRSLDFVASRFARIYPIYLLSVITTILITNIARFAKPRTENTYDIILNFFMLQDFLGGRSVNIVYWTLTLEISFYAIMLIVYRFRLVKYIDIICGLWLFIILLDIARAYLSSDSTTLLHLSTTKFSLLYPTQLGFLTFPNQPSNILVFLKDFIKTNFVLLQGRAVFFIAGIMLYQGKMLGFSLYRLALIILCILAKALDYASGTPRYSFIFFAAFVIIMYLVVTDRLKSLSIRPLIFLGTISYALYLTHLQVNWLIESLFVNIPPEISIIIKTLVAIIVASCLTFTIELPAMKLIKSQYKKILA